MTAEIATHARSLAEARALTDRIRVGLEGTWLLIEEAIRTRCWIALGYGSWDEYRTREFGHLRLRLPREDRDEQVMSLRTLGLSGRAIASVTGLSRNTVAAIERQVAQSEPPAPSLGLDGKTYARPAFAAATNRHPEPEDLPRPERSMQVIESAKDVADHLAAIDDALRDEVVDTATGEIAPGMTPPKRRQRPLPDAFRDASWDLGKVTERITRLADDPRFPRNAEQVAAMHRSDLLRARDALQSVLNRLP